MGSGKSPRTPLAPRRPGPSSPVPAVAFALLVGASAACGPSFQVVYEGNSRFEHCYALEENPRIGMPDKAACWREWSEHYTYGQTRDRVHYATARYVALSQAPTTPTDEALMMAAPGETPRATTITAPAPTSAFAPPPKVLDPAAQPVAMATHPGEGVPLVALDAGAPEPAAPAPLPGSSCVDGCGGIFRACDSDCAERGDAKGKCGACQRAYRTCMRGCFR